MSMDQVGRAIQAVASKIVTVRTGTVFTNYAALDRTSVILDNDPSNTPVAAQGVSAPLPLGARVYLLAYPPRGLVVLGSLAEFGENNAAQAAQTTATITITTVVQVLTGTTINFFTRIPNAIIITQSSYDVNQGGANGGDFFAGTLELDGVQQSGNTVFSAPIVPARSTMGIGHVVKVATPGAHTLRLAALKFGAASVITTNSLNTKLIMHGQFNL